MKKSAKIFILIIIIFILGGLGGVVFDKYLLPKLSTHSFFSKCPLLQKANENVTVINKVERVVVEEEKSIDEVALKASKSLMTVVSIDAKKESKIGIGVAISSDGLVMVHRNSILEEQAKYQAFDHKGDSHKATLLGIDEYSDLAFLQADTSNLNVIPFSDFEELEVGKKVIAIGNFLTTNQKSFAIGFVEGFNDSFNLAGKTLSYSDKLEGVFEMSFDSEKYVGGPVINHDGEMVGVTGKAVVDNKDYYFQISANDVKEIVARVFERELQNRAKLGVYYVSLSNVNASIFEQERTQGALVYASSGRQSMAVIAKSVGEKAGIKIGDVIVSVNGEKVNQKNPLSKLVAKHKKGDKAEMVVERNGQEMNLEVQF